MLFPWKKLKSTVFSQLSSDQIHQKCSKNVRVRSSSLVVETGFPASLVDLFVKNKDKFKKPWRKRNKLRRISSSPLDYDNYYDDDDKESSFLLEAWPCPPPPPSPVASLPLNSPAKTDQVVLNDRNVGGEIIESGSANRVVTVILLVLLVAVFGFGSRKFMVVGTTMLAFLMLFVEYMRKHNTEEASFVYLSKIITRLSCIRYELCIGKAVFELLRLCEEVKEKLGLIIQDGMEIFRRGNGRKFAHDMSIFIRPIPILKPKYCVKELESAKKKIDNNGNCNTFHEENIQVGMVVLEQDKGCGNNEMKRIESCKARMKLKIKEFVPKKLRKTSRKRNEECDSRKSVNEEDIIDNLDSCSALLKVEETLNEEDGRKIEIEKNSGYVVILLIVLIGLIGGRIMALVLTLSWCLIWKIGKTLRKYINIPYREFPC